MLFRSIRQPTRQMPTVTDQAMRSSDMPGSCQDRGTTVGRAAYARVMSASPGSATDTFAARLAAAVEARSSQIVLGLDPDPARLWPVAHDGDDRGAIAPAERAGASVAAHCRAVIDAAGPACVAVKPQLACFERLGAPGWAALEATVAHAHARGLLVLADGKRGDIDVSAAAYAQALVGVTPTPYGDVARSEERRVGKECRL